MILFAAVWLFSPILTTTSAAAYPASGRAAVVGPDQVTPLRSGGSGTLFSLVLPSGARCAGDTAHDGYQLYSFLIPAGVDPHQESFPQTVPAKWYGMYTSTRYFASNLDPGTGRPLALPRDFTWERLSADMLLPAATPSATWQAGLVCVSGRYHLENYWTAEFTFVRSTTDPGGFSFSIPNPAPVHHAGGRYWLGVVPFGVVVVLVLAALGFRRAARRGNVPPRTASS